MIARHIPRFREAYRELPQLADRERWSRASIEEFQLERLNAVWRRAIREVPHYYQLRHEFKLPDAFRTLAEYRYLVPVLPKQVVRDEPKQFLSALPDSGRWHHTSGSTGIPLKVFWGTDAYREVLRCRYRYYQAWGVDIFDPQVFLWGRGAAMHPGLRGHVARMRQFFEDRLRNRLRLPAYRLNPTELQNYLRRMRDFRPVALYGFSQAVYLLALEADTTQFECDSLRLVTLTSELATVSCVAAIERAFRVPAVMEYGAVETGLIAQEQPDRTLRVREDMTYVETLPRDDGRFDIVLTILNNPSFPLLRYQIADVTDAPLSVPEAGFAKLENVIGRTCDFLRTRSGARVHYTRIAILLDLEYSGIKQFQVHQDATGAVTFRVTLHDLQQRHATDGLAHKVSELLEGFPVDVVCTDAIPQTPAGKHRLVSSELVERERSVAEHGHSYAGVL